MLTRISSLYTAGLRSTTARQSKSVSRVSTGRSSGARSLARCYSNFGSILSTNSSRSSSIASKTVYPLQKITKRYHAGCGMPHSGDELPGVGMERELRAHLNVTDLIIEDTSGTSNSMKFTPYNLLRARKSLIDVDSPPYLFLHFNAL